MFYVKRVSDWPLVETYYTGQGRIEMSRRPDEKFVVLADGQELETIKLQFTNIPMHSGEVVTWSGDIARFIIDNIKL